MNKTWKSEEWKRNVAKFLLLHPKCDQCGEPSTVAHHPKRRGGYTKAEYISLVGCQPKCRRCHFAIKMHLELCPICKKHYFRISKKKPKTCCKTCFDLIMFNEVRD